MFGMERVDVIVIVIVLAVAISNFEFWVCGRSVYPLRNWRSMSCWNFLLQWSLWKQLMGIKCLFLLLFPLRVQVVTLWWARKTCRHRYDWDSVVRRPKWNHISHYLTTKTINNPPGFYKSNENINWKNNVVAIRVCPAGPSDVAALSLRTFIWLSIVESSSSLLLSGKTGLSKASDSSGSVVLEVTTVSCCTEVSEVCAIISEAHSSKSGCLLGVCYVRKDKEAEKG